MAALDPSAAPDHIGTANGDQLPRATLKLIYDTMDEKDDDAKREELLRALLGNPNGEAENEEDEGEESSDDEEKNGGPSDPSKTKKARKEAAALQLLQSLQNGANDSDEDMEDASSGPKLNGDLPKDNKGKGKAVASAEESDDDEEEETEVVLCTLDPNQVGRSSCFISRSTNIELQHYQQTLDITIPEGTNAYFKVSGTHAVYVTGNYVVSPNKLHEHDHDEDSDDYDLSPDEDELGDEESDELDGLEDPRITEVDSEVEAPKLVKKDKLEPVQKGRNKRSAEESNEEPATLDAIIDKSLEPADSSAAAEPKLSKKQLKKLKNNAGKAVEAVVDNKDVKEDESSTPKNDKKVQFAKNLEQGPSGATKDTKPGKDVEQEPKGDVKPGKQEKEKSKASLGVKTLQNGLKIDDRKLGTGPAAKKGDKVGLRYVGKLENGKEFGGKTTF